MIRCRSILRIDHSMNGVSIGKIVWARQPRLRRVKVSPYTKRILFFVETGGVRLKSHVCNTVLIIKRDKICYHKN